MTIFRPYSQWFDPGWTYASTSWFKRRISSIKMNMTRGVRDLKMGDNHIVFAPGWYEYMDDYYDISTATSFVTAEDTSYDECLGELGYYDGPGFIANIELRHMWICGAHGVRIYNSDYWRTTHWNRTNHNPRLQELIDS